MCGLAAADVVKPCSWTLYKQCDGQWAHNPLGTSSNTICSAGCAMSSVAMSLTTKGETIGGATVTPGARPGPPGGLRIFCHLCAD